MNFSRPMVPPVGKKAIEYAAGMAIKRPMAVETTLVNSEFHA